METGRTKAEKILPDGTRVIARGFQVERPDSQEIIGRCRGEWEYTIELITSNKVVYEGREFSLPLEVEGKQLNFQYGPNEQRLDEVMRPQDISQRISSIGDRKDILNFLEYFTGKSL